MDKIDNFSAIKNAVLIGFSAIGGFIGNQLGGWDSALKVLIGIMAADYITGIIVAGFFKNSSKSRDGSLSSKAGFYGLCRKCLILMLVWSASMVDRLLGDSFVRTTVCMFFISNEGISVLENAGLMGIPFPESLKNMFQILKEKGNN